MPNNGQSTKERLLRQSQIRDQTDVLFAEQRGPLPLTNKFSKFDHLVRDAFLPSVIIVVRAG
jgi:hypothetical protein